MSTTGKVRQVGVDLQDSEDTHALVDAIEADNPGAEVVHMPGLIRVTTAGELVIRRDSVTEQLGRPVRVCNDAGVQDDKIVIKWEH